MRYASEMVAKTEKRSVLMSSYEASLGSQCWAKSKKTKWGLSCDKRVVIWGCMSLRLA